MTNGLRAPYRVVGLGPRLVELPGPHLGYMSATSHCSWQRDEMMQRLRTCGYILLRGVLEPSRVEDARAAILSALHERGVLRPDRPPAHAVVADRYRDGVPLTWDVASVGPYVDLVRGAAIIELFEVLFGGEVVSFDFRWLRVVPPGGVTGAHLDVVYMGRGTRDLLTVWIPLGRISAEMGPLAVLEGAELSRVFETYGNADIDQDHLAGWFSDDPVELVERYGGRWSTHDFEPGDVVVHTLTTMHCSLVNRTRSARISSDTRYQSADSPRDDRWFGDPPRGHEIWHRAVSQRQMAAVRVEWGL